MSNTMRQAMDHDIEMQRDKVSILLADDHKMIIEAIQSNLIHESGFDVHVAFNLSETLSSLRSRTGGFDLILLDINMPGMEGLRSVKQVIDAAAQGAVVIFSGSVDQDFIWQAIDLGAKGFIPKGLPLRSLGTTLQLIADGNDFVPMEFSRKRHQASDHDSGFTEQERLILKAVAAGKTNKEIAIEAGKTEVTIKMKMRSICSRLNAKNRAHAAIIASQKGIV